MAAVIYRGSTPTFKFNVSVSLITATSVEVLFIQGGTIVRGIPVLDTTNNAITVHLTNQQTAQFSSGSDLEVQVIGTWNNVKSLVAKYTITVAKNLYELQQEAETLADGPGYFTLMDPEDDDDPSEFGWYEYNSTTERYFLTQDTSVDDDKDYYAESGSLWESISDDIVEPEELGISFVLLDDELEISGISPAAQGWYEKDLNDDFVPTTDVTLVSAKEYYAAVDAKYDNADYMDEYDLFSEEEFDGESFIEDENVIDMDEQDVDETDYEPWDPMDEFTEFDPTDDQISFTQVSTPTGNPIRNGYFEYDSQTAEYIVSSDETVDGSKTYYTVTLGA